MTLKEFRDKLNNMTYLAEQEVNVMFLSQGKHLKIYDVRFTFDAQGYGIVEIK